MQFLDQYSFLIQISILQVIRLLVNIFLWKIINETKGVGVVFILQWRDKLRIKLNNF